MLKKALFALALLFGLVLALPAAAQDCSGVFGANQICGNNTASPDYPRPYTAGGDFTFLLGNGLLATVNANVGTFGSATQCLTVTTNAKGLITAVSAATCTPAAGSITGTIGIAGGGTGQTTKQPAFNALAPTATRAGDVIYWNGTNWVTLAGNNSGSNCFQENASGVPSWASCGGANIPLGVRARITLQSGVPVMTTSQTAKTTLIVDCYGGSTVIYFDGTNDVYESIPSCEVSTGMAGSGTGVLNANGVFDVWWVHTGANRICIATNGSGGGWASDTAGSNTARGTGYSQIDFLTRGYPTNKNALPNCFNGSTNYGSVPANRATYLGTICTDAAAAGSVSHTLGAASAGGTPGRLCVWNMYNRVNARAFVADTSANHVYGLGTIRQCSGLTTMAIVFVSGLAEDGIDVAVAGQVVTAPVASSYGVLGYGLDSTTSNVKYTFAQNPVAVSISVSSGISGSLDPQVGLHTLTCNEQGDNVNNSTFVGGLINPQRIELKMPR